MKIVYLGSGEFGIECLNAIQRSSHELRLVVTQPARPAGRGGKTRPTAVARWADDHQVPVLEAAGVNRPEVLNRIASCEPELIVVIAFGQKIGPKLIEMPPKGIINVHASLLPKLRGAAPINWAIVNGLPETGNTIICVEERMDAGKMLASNSMPVAPDDTAGTLHDKLAQAAAPLLIETLDAIEAGAATYTEQDDSAATYAPKLDKSAGHLDFSQPAEYIERKIRGFSPWPGASAVYEPKSGGKRTKVCFESARVIEHTNPKAAEPGTLDDDLNVICSRNALKIKQIRPACGRPMSFADFVNGRHCRPGDKFTSISSVQT